jgi:type I restriction-modification system DNA methylase subunit
VTNSNEAATDQWVGDKLRDAGIERHPQGITGIKEIDEALKTSSKRKTGKVGKPEFVIVTHSQKYGDFVIVIEDKLDTAKQQHLDQHTGLLLDDIASITDYAMNGAWWYARHIVDNTSYKHAIAIGISGDEKHHIIQPLHYQDGGGLDYKMLPEVEEFISFNADNIDEYYQSAILEEKTDEQKTTQEVLKDAAELHEYLRNYGTLGDRDKPLVISGILLALREIKHGGFDINSLNHDPTKTDGEKIWDAIKNNLKRSNVRPEVKRDKILSQFDIIKNSAKLNEPAEELGGKTPLRYFTDQLNRRLYPTITKSMNGEDYLGRFYGEFMSYSGGDGQTLGIILTPKHICDLFCELLDLQPDDIVFDPCCGTGGFLISAMRYMLAHARTDAEMDHIRKHQLLGIEIQDYMFTIATTNMIVRGDGKSNLKCEDFFNEANSPNLLQQIDSPTVGMMNPPYSQGKKSQTLCELSFVERLLDSMTEDGRVAVIVPQSAMTGKTKYEKKYKASILKHHTLEGVITCNTETFYGVGTNPVIAVFTAHKPNSPEHKSKFIDFQDDGYSVHAHIGLEEGSSAKDKQSHLLRVWRGEEQSPSSFCVESAVTAEDEWLHAYFYFNDEIPTEDDFTRAIADYLTFQLDTVGHGRGYLFGFENSLNGNSEDNFNSTSLITGDEINA